MSRSGRASIAYDDVGVGANVIVLIHGHPFCRAMWQPQVEHLSALGWRVIAPDLRGYGGSPSSARMTTLETFANDIAGLLDALGVDSAVIAGLSMGGQIAMEFCRAYRGRVRGLVLAATFPQQETPEGRAARLRMAEHLLQSGMEQYANEVLPRMLAPSFIERQPDVAQFVLRMMRNTDPVGAAAALRGRAERPSYEATLAALQAPSLIVVGSEDAFTTRADADTMNGLLRGSRLLWLEGVGHMPNLEAAEPFNAAVAELLASLGRA